MVGANVVQHLRQRLAVDQNVLRAVILAGIILLGAALRIYDLGAEGYWIDELVMLRVAGNDFDTVIAETQAGRPPAYVVLAFGWMKLFGASEVATRSLSAVAGIAALPVMYLLARELFGWRVGMLSTLLMALSEFQIYHSQDFRYYSVFTLFTLLSFYGLVRALQVNRWPWWSLYVIASVLMVYTHSFGLFALVPQGLYVLLSWWRYGDARLRWVVSQGMIGLCLAPEAWRAINKGTSGTADVHGWIMQENAWEMLETLRIFVLPTFFYLSDKRLTACAIWFVVGMTVFLLWKGRRRWLAALRGLVPTTWRQAVVRRNALLLVCLWLAGVIVIPFVLSYILEPMYVHRYVIGAAPAWYMLLALAAFSIHSIVPVPILLGMFLLLVGPGLRDYYVLEMKEQWQKMADYIDARNQPGDVIVFAPDYDGDLLEFYQIYSQEDAPGCSLYPEQRDNASIAADLSACTAGYDRFWLLIRGNPKRSQHLRDFFFDTPHTTMTLMQSEQFNQGVSIHLFKLTQ